MTNYPNTFVRDETIAGAILADPSASNREIARRMGVSHPYVAKIRKLIEDDAFEAAPNRAAWEQLVRMYAARAVAYHTDRDRIEHLEALLAEHGIVP